MRAACRSVRAQSQIVVPTGRVGLGAIVLRVDLLPQLFRQRYGLVDEREHYFQSASDPLKDLFFISTPTTLYPFPIANIKVDPVEKLPLSERELEPAD